ncbi:MAG TPA: DMT family transporter [Saprospiraceae bacterium]|nr:DMT family transporter [Saprospiraceae bacterium]HMP12564.1 DMT family transporter [Saprospiraceae bacterium]
MDKIIWIILVAIAGSLLPVQAGLNTKMGKEIASPVWASLISFVVGAIALLIYVAITKNAFQVSGFKTVPAYTWVAGALGAFYVTVVVLAFPKLGPALTFGLIVAGQLLISLFLDHFNILVHQQHSINIYRIIGMLLIVGGVVLIRKF